ncbi:MAG: hypothetical protein ACRBCK_06860 [Alphaproteobacteria bacterium]
MGKYAHFESKDVTTLQDLYTRHAEVARDIHQDALRRFTGDQTLTVDLVKESPISADKAVLDKLSEYDSVSVSTGVALGTIISQSGLASGDNIAMYRDYFSENDMPVYTVAAGNKGGMEEGATPRLADFSRSSLVVGEANLSAGKPYIEEHSSKVDITLSADNPFNRGEKYQYYDVSPSLGEHEDLVRGWVIDSEVQRGIDLFLEHNKDKGLDQSVLDEGVQGISEALHDKYRVNEGDIARIDGIVQAYIENPENLHSLEAYKDLIRDWVIDNEVQRGIDLFLEHNKDKGLDQSVLDEGVRGIYDALHDKYRVNEGDIARIDGIVKAYIENPQTLHSQVMAEFREQHDIDENGYVTGLDGTSFSAPEQAGFVSGALHEQEQREEENLPILTKDEISTLAKLATTDTPIREGNDLMKLYNNRADHTLTYAGGHGVFNPDMFRELLDTAYKKIETSPDIDRDVVEVTVPASSSDAKQRGASVRFDFSAFNDQNIIIERTRIDGVMNVNGTVPHHMVFNSDDGSTNFQSIQMASAGRSNFAIWMREETQFGEKIDNDYDLSMRFLGVTSTTLNSAEMTVYGYNEGSFMHQMMDYSKEIAPQFTSQPEDVKPEVMPAVLTSDDDALSRPSTTTETLRL